MSVDITTAPNTTTNTSPITITPSALEQLKGLRAELKVAKDHFLRIGVRGGGCSGFEYQLGFDLPAEDDKQLQSCDEVVIRKPGHALYLLGMYCVLSTSDPDDDLSA